MVNTLQQRIHQLEWKDERAKLVAKLEHWVCLQTPRNRRSRQTHQSKFLPKLCLQCWKHWMKDNRGNAV